MIKNYIKIAYRSMIRNKLFSFINITGLSIGLACCMIIFLFINYELSFDSFHSNSDRIYRVNINTKTPDGGQKESCVPFPFVNAFRNDFPQVKNITQIFFQDESQIEIEKNIFFQNNIAFTDTAFFNVFDYELIIGKQEGILSEPGNAILTESLSLKLFGRADPIGKTLSIDRTLQLTVAGILKDPPTNTNLPIEMLISLNTLTEEFVGFDINKWGIIHSSNRAYFLLPEKLNILGIISEMDNFDKKYIPEDSENKEYYFQPLSQVHLDTEYGINNYNYVTGKDTIFILSAIGFLILIIASINFVNLSIAQSIKRSKEVGMRKVIGANRIHIIGQFVGESFLFTLIAFLLSIVITYYVLPFAGDLLGNNASLSIFNDWIILIYLALTFVVVNILTGLYPSIILSKFNPVEAFKNKLIIRKANSFSFKNGLIVFQFIISQVLILSTIIISYQLFYVKNKDLGFKKDNIITIGLPDVKIEKKRLFKEKLLQNSSISKVTLSGGAPISDMFIDTYYNKIPQETHDKFPVQLKPIDEDYLETFGIKILGGSNFKKAVEGDTLYEFIANKEALKKIGISNYSNAIGQTIQFSRIKAKIVGVVNNFHTASLQNEINPVLLSNKFEKFYSEVQIKTNALSKTNVINDIKKSWDEVFPEYNMQYTFFDNYLSKLYKVEDNFFNTVRLFAVIAIMISCLGLIGLVSFVTVQKTKEIGIRKTLGASINDIVSIIAREFTKNIIIANLIAWPLAFYLLNKWLEGFAYRIDVEWWMFAFSGVLALLIAFVTISFQSVKAAIANPVNSLKNE